MTAQQVYVVMLDAGGATVEPNIAGALSDWERAAGRMVV